MKYFHVEQVLLASGFHHHCINSSSSSSPTVHSINNQAAEDYEECMENAGWIVLRICTK